MLCVRSALVEGRRNGRRRNELSQAHNSRKQLRERGPRYMREVVGRMRMVRTPKKRTRACLLCCTISISHKSCSAVGGLVTIGRCRSEEPIPWSHRCAVEACVCLGGLQRPTAHIRRQRQPRLSLLSCVKKAGCTTISGSEVVELGWSRHLPQAETAGVLTSYPWSYLLIPCHFLTLSTPRVYSVSSAAAANL